MTTECDHLKTPKKHQLLTPVPPSPKKPRVATQEEIDEHNRKAAISYAAADAAEELYRERRRKAIQEQRAAELAARAKYDWCAFCGKTENIERIDDVANYIKFYDFCKGTDCLDHYADFAHSGGKNMMHGIPVCYAKTGKTLREPATRETTKRGKPRNLYCDYCGAHNNKVITNTQIHPSFKHANFCMNITCCRRYLDYVQNVPRVPYGFTVNFHYV
jgi:hypothetical protein